MYLASTWTLKYILQFLIPFQGVLTVFIYGITFQKPPSKDGTISGLTRLEKSLLQLSQSQFPLSFMRIIIFSNFLFKSWKNLLMDHWKLRVHNSVFGIPGNYQFTDLLLTKIILSNLFPMTTLWKKYPLSLQTLIYMARKGDNSFYVANRPN